MKTKFLLTAVFAAAIAALASTTTYNYDAAGRIVSADAGGKSISYAYDNAGNLLQSSQPAPGMLIAQVTGNQVALTWPASPGGFRLQSSPTLGAAANWTDVAGSPALLGNRYVLTTGIAAPKFYRLIKP